MRVRKEAVVFYIAVLIALLLHLALMLLFLWVTSERLRSTVNRLFSPHGKTGTFFEDRPGSGQEDTPGVTAQTGDAAQPVAEAESASEASAESATESPEEIGEFTQPEAPAELGESPTPEVPVYEPQELQPVATPGTLAEPPITETQPSLPVRRKHQFRRNRWKKTEETSLSTETTYQTTENSPVSSSEPSRSHALGKQLFKRAEEKAQQTVRGAVRGTGGSGTGRGGRGEPRTYSKQELQDGFTLQMFSKKIQQAANNTCMWFKHLAFLTEDVYQMVSVELTLERNGTLSNIRFITPVKNKTIATVIETFLKSITFPRVPNTLPAPHVQTYRFSVDYKAHEGPTEFVCKPARD